MAILAGNRGISGDPGRITYTGHTGPIHLKAIDLLQPIGDRVKLIVATILELLLHLDVSRYSQKGYIHARI